MSSQVSRQSIYAHFPTREALLEAIIERAAAEVAAAFDGAKLDGLCPALAETASENPSSAYLLAQ
jgi:AcrR family transcriptional regulator